MRIVMTLRVRDEADVLEQMLRFHRAQGVDRFVVADDRSTDGSVEILRRWSEAGLVELLNGDSVASWRPHREWLTGLARHAAERHAADWVVNTDADEFWWPLHGTLAQTLAAIPGRHWVLSAPRTEFVPRPGDEPFAERMLHRERVSSTMPKLAHRAHPRAEATPHAVRIPGAGFPRHRGRAWLRPPGEGQQVGDVPAPAPIWPVRVLHYPLRSVEQFESRVRRARELGRHGTSTRAQELYEALGHRSLAAAYAEVVYDDERVEAGVRDGELVEDTRLRDFLREVPEQDGLADWAPAAPPPVWPGEEAELAHDGIASLVRSEVVLEERMRSARRRIRRLEQEGERGPTPREDDASLRRRVARRMRNR